MEQFKQVSLTWFRAAAASAVALYLAGQTDLKVLATAALTGFLGPVLKWLDPSASEFGRGSKQSQNALLRASEAVLSHFDPLPKVTTQGWGSFFVPPRSRIGVIQFSGGKPWGRNFR